MLFPKLKGSRGLTGIEVAIIIVIILIIAAIAIPRLLPHMTQLEMQTMARDYLSRIAVAEKQYKDSTGRYFTTVVGDTASWDRPYILKPIGIEIRGNCPYQFTVVATVNGYLAVAKANIDSDEDFDVWRMTESSPQPIVWEDDSKN